MGSIETLQKEDVNLFLSSHRKTSSFQAALRMEAQKMTNEINFYQEEIASNKEQIELVRNRIERSYISFAFQYKTEIKKQTGIKVDTTKQIDKLNADITRTQNNYAILEKTDV